MGVLEELSEAIHRDVNSHLLFMRFNHFPARYSVFSDYCDDPLTQFVESV